jgi:hypothetical protein
MITTDDFLKPAYTPDLTESGVAMAARFLAHQIDHLGGSLYAQLRQVVGEVAVELAFRRLLSEKEVPFEVKANLPFSDPNRFDVSLGGHRCEVHTFLVSKRNQITAMKQAPSALLETPALLKEHQFSSSTHLEKDLHVFGFLLGITSDSEGETRKAQEAGQPTYLLHPLKTGWSVPQNWTSLGKLTLKSECPTAIRVEVGGLDINRTFTSESMTLEPLKKANAQNEYYSLAYVHAEKLPEARLGLHSSGKDELYLILPHEWGNIWVYGMEIWLAGYIPQEEFRRKASTTFSGSRVFQYSTTQTKSLSVSVKELRPLEKLFSEVIQWKNGRRSWDAR